MHRDRLPSARAGFAALARAGGVWARFVLAAGAAAASAMPATLAAQTLPLGPEVQVDDTFTTGEQTDAAVASPGNGTFVVVWDSASNDGSASGIAGRVFDSVGSPIGSEFRINAYTTNYQFDVSVAADPQGNFVVVWTSVGEDGSGYGIFGQRFSRTGRVGGEFQVNTYTTGDQYRPRIAMDPEGGFVVVWNSVGQDGSGFGVFGQRFDSSGAKVDAEFQINTYTTGDQRDPEIAADRAGDFVVVWQSYRQDASSFGVVGQRFDAAGAKVGGEFLVNTYTTDKQLGPRIAADARGNFVVIWSSYGQDGSKFGVFGQRFNSAAEKVGAEFPVNTFVSSNQTAGGVALDRNGDFVVAWDSEGEYGSETGVFGQRFGRLKDRIGFEFPIKAVESGDDFGSAIASDGVGFVVAWTDYGHDGSDDTVLARRQVLSPTRLAVDEVARAGTTSDTDGVLEPGENASIDPSYLNAGAAGLPLTGQIFSFSGPIGGTYSIEDPTSSYGTIASNASGSCDDASAAACYVLRVDGTRPTPHWDATLQETLSSGGTQIWTLHVGDSFSDVPRSQPFYKKIETLLHHGITSGCGGGTTYCPDDAVPRDQMAIFVAKGIAGAGELVPTAGRLDGSPYNCSPGGVSRFSDVLPGDSFCKHVHYLAAQNVTLGCGPGAYCPSLTITRDAMASFIAKAIVAPGGGDAVPLTYGPDPGTGRSYSCDAGSPSTHFTDVPTTSSFCKHIHYLWAKGIVDGCSATLYCPTQAVHRDAMAKFIANGFALQLYGP